METNRPIDADEASVALASVRHSRARVAWGGYPAWYWLTTGAGLGMGTAAILLPTWWGSAIAVVIAVGLAVAAYAAGRARGVCEGWTNTAMTWREKVVLYGPATAVIFTSGMLQRLDLLPPWWPAVAAVLVFGLFTGSGFALSTRAARR